MFGYISPDRPYLFIKDEELYKAMYCGVCKGIGEGCGQTARSALTYDMAFMSALIHNINGVDVKVEKKRCAAHLIKKRPMANTDELTILLGYVNTALAYYKLADDVADGEKRGALKFLYKKGFKRAQKKYPRICNIIKEQTDAQAKLEKEGCAVIDMACEPSANMIKLISREAFGDKATEFTDILMYAVGKWIYLADALDDYDKDVKKGRYNVLYNAYKKPTKAEAVKENEAELIFVFDSLFADMRYALNNIKFYFNHDLTDNIILRGIPVKTRVLLYGRCGEGKKKEKTNTEGKDSQ